MSETPAAALIRRTGDRARDRARALTGDRFDGVWLLRLAAPDVLVEPWVGVLEDVADVVDEAAARVSALRSTESVRPYPWTDRRPQTRSGPLRAETDQSEGDRWAA